MQSGQYMQSPKHAAGARVSRHEVSGWQLGCEAATGMCNGQHVQLFGACTVPTHLQIGSRATLPVLLNQVAQFCAVQFVRGQVFGDLGVGQTQVATQLAHQLVLLVAGGERAFLHQRSAPINTSLPCSHATVCLWVAAQCACTMLIHWTLEYSVQTSNRPHAAELLAGSSPSPPS